MFSTYLDHAICSYSTQGQCNVMIGDEVGIDRSLRLDQVIVHIDASYISMSDTYDRLLG
jgi:hypothetical protein